LVWRNRKKISQIIKDYFYLPFFLLFILCMLETPEACTLSILASLDLEGQQIELPRCFADFCQRRLCFSSSPARG
jgi:hypothetical protein